MKQNFVYILEWLSSTYSHRCGCSVLSISETPKCVAILFERPSYKLILVEVVEK